MERWALVSGWTAIATDGNKRHDWPITFHDGNDTYERAVWERNEKAWLEIEYGLDFKGQLRVLRHRLEGATTEEVKMPLPPSDTVDDVTGAWFTPAGHLLLSIDGEHEGRFYSSGLFYDYARLDGKTSPNVTVMTLPGVTDVNSVSLSPDGKRFVWEFYKAYPPPSTFERIFLMRETRYARSLWISDAEGNMFQRLTPDVDILHSEQAPKDPEWTPDSRRICYWTEQGLWIIAAP